MLNINIKLVAQNLAPGLENGVYEVPEGATVRELLTVCEVKNGIEITEQNFKMMLFILNGKNTLPDAVINEDGTLHICRVITGG